MVWYTVYLKNLVGKEQTIEKGTKTWRQWNEIFSTIERKKWKYMIFRVDGI